MKIAFNPSTVAALITPPNNKDITFDLRGQNIFARGVKFCGTDTNTWRDIKINNVSIGSHTLDLRNGSNTTLTNTNGVITINSTWRPVVDNLTSDSTTSSLSAKQGKVLKSLIDGKSDSEHNHDDRYLKLTGGTMASNALITFADSGSWSTDKGPQGARGGLYWTGQSDYAKLYAEETAGDNLDLVIQFGNDNSNGLSIRNASNVQTSYISAGGVITTGTFKGNLDWSYITNKPFTATRWPSWDEIANKPNTFTPSDHNHDGRYVYNYGDNQMDGASINKNALGMATNSGITRDWWHILQAARNGEYRWNSLIAFPTLNRNGMYYRSGLDDNTAWGSWVKLLDVNNYSSTLDSRYYTESEVNTLLDAKLNRQNLSYGTWNPRGYNLAADYTYNGGDLSISESGGLIHVSVDGYFWLNKGQYRVLDTSDVDGLKSTLTIHLYLSNTDTTWWPLIWGGSSHNNTSDFTGNVYKSYDKLSWLTSSLTLYATNIQTNNIKNLSIGGGIYWNPYVESTTDGSDAASITLVRLGIAGGTTLVLSLRNDANDTILFQTNGSARLYHNSYPILTTLNTYVSGNKGYINGTEITLVNNADTVDGYHATSGRTFDGNINWSSNWNNLWDDGTNKHPWYGFDHRYPNTGAYSTTITDYFGMTIKTFNTLRLDFGTLLLNGTDIHNINVASATKLQTPRSLWGQSFDGTGNVNGTIYINNSDSENGAIILNNNVNTHARISAIKDQVIFNTGNAIRFGETAWDWNQWAGLKYTYSNKTIYLGIADGSIFNSNSACSGGILNLRAGISNIDLNSGTSIRGLPTNGSPYVSYINLYDTSISLSAYGGVKLSCLDANASISSDIKVEASQGVYLNSGNSGNVYLCLGGGNVSIGYRSPSYKLDVNGLVRASGFHHGSVNSDNYMLLAGGGYKSFGGSGDSPIFLGYLNLDHGNDGTTSSSFVCLGYSVPFTYTRGGNYCNIHIPDTSYQIFFIRAAIASVNYSGGGMDTWVGNHRGEGAWWLHCYASSSNEVRVKGFCLRNAHNDSWWGGNPLWSDNSGANRITVCIFGYVSFR